MPASTKKKPATPRKQDKTARILESIETLLALQEEQSQSRQGNQDQLIEQLESVETRLAELSPAASAPSAHSDLALERIEALEAELTQRLDQMSQAIKHSEPALTPKHLNSLQAKIVKQVEKQVTDKLLKRFADFEHQLSGQIESLQNFIAPAEAPTLGNSESESALLEQLELISLQLEQWEDQSNPGTNQDPVDYQRLEELIQSLTGNEGDSSNSLQSLQEIHDRLEQLESYLVSQESKEGFSHPSFEKFDEQLNHLKDEIQNLRQSPQDIGELTSLLEGISSVSRSDIAEEVQAVSTQVTEDLKKHFAHLVDKANTSSSDLNVSDAARPEIAPSEDEDTASHWHKQKRAMLAKYGIDPEYRPLEDNAVPSVSKALQENVVESETASSTQLEELHETIENISPADSEAIEKLKKELNKKLRDAEVELSINRAKLSQQKAELEQRQAELEQKNADLEARLKSAQENGGNSGKKEGIMSRFARHLGRNQ